MRLTPFCIFPLAVSAARIVQSNDDGWAEKNIRTFHDALIAAGHNAVLSAPANDGSGTGRMQADPEPLSDESCEFDSCPPGSPAVGNNASDTRLNYVNSYPATSMKYGITDFAPKFFGGEAPELAVTGPNVGANMDIQLPFSGTVGAAVFAVSASIPAIAFSGHDGDKIPWDVPTPLYSSIYADLALNVTTHILESGTPYLPDDVFLNVNFPQVTNGSCDKVEDFKFVLSRVNIQTVFASTPDVKTCGNTRLPMERAVIGTVGCYASISVGNASDLTTATADAQAVVLNKLDGFLSCLPDDDLGLLDMVENVVGMS